MSQLRIKQTSYRDVYVLVLKVNSLKKININLIIKVQGTGFHNTEVTMLQRFIVTMVYIYFITIVYSYITLQFDNVTLFHYSILQPYNIAMLHRPVLGEFFGVFWFL